MPPRGRHRPYPSNGRRPPAPSGLGSVLSPIRRTGVGAGSKLGTLGPASVVFLPREPRECSPRLRRRRRFSVEGGLLPGTAPRATLDACRPRPTRPRSPPACGAQQTPSQRARDYCPGCAGRMQALGQKRVGERRNASTLSGRRKTLGVVGLGPHAPPAQRLPSAPPASLRPSFCQALSIRALWPAGVPTRPALGDRPSALGRPGGAPLLPPVLERLRLARLSVLRVHSRGTAVSVRTSPPSRGEPDARPPPVPWSGGTDGNQVSARAEEGADTVHPTQPGLGARGRFGSGGSSKGDPASSTGPTKDLSCRHTPTNSNFCIAPAVGSREPIFRKRMKSSRVCSPPDGLGYHLGPLGFSLTLF